jgi:hypothetical protein
MNGCSYNIGTHATPKRCGAPCKGNGFLCDRHALLCQLEKENNPIQRYEIEHDRFELLAELKKENGVAAISEREIERNRIMARRIGKAARSR